uniref:PiggyBac transposable element-derived protein domain-containing protein n=1 Tax=Cacopsylla melanoneura TaxID=428564 RepID=A0A8D9E2Z3_9HEMI
MNEERPDNLVDNEDAILEVLCQESDDDEQQGQEEIEEQIDSEDEDCDDEDRDPNYDPSSESLEDNILKNIEKNFEESRKPPVKKRRKETTSSKSKNTNQDPIVNAPSEEIRGKDGFVWHSTARKGTTKVSSKNIVRAKPGPKTMAASSATDPISCFKLFFDEDIIGKMLIHTNEEIARKRARYSTNHQNISDTNIAELDAILGLLVLSAALKDNHVQTNLLFDSTYCGNRYRATMSEHRFKFLINCIRFDNKETRERKVPIARISKK